VEVLACGHFAAAAGARVCAHLTTDDSRGCYRVLTGVATRYDLLCEPCADTEAPELLDACVGCFDRAEGDAYLGWRGVPEIRRDDRDLGGTWTTLPGFTPRNDRCLAPLPDGWLAWTAEGLVALGPEPRYVAWVELLAELPSNWAGRVRGPALHTSPDGRFAAAVTDYGRHGAIVDLASGTVTLELDRGDYHPEQTAFPVAFLGTQVVAATDWNRLDVFDAATGRQLTERDPDGDQALDYFFGALVASPSGRWLLADGWVWAPMGVPMVLDGRTLDHSRRLAERAYAWGDPVAWLDDETVVQQRIGDDDEQMLDGVTLYDTVTGHRKGLFAGPNGRMWAHDGLLHVAAEDGFEIWDPVEGARIAFAEGFHPIAHNSGAFAELRNDQLRIWTSAR
jgi:hypothetical protein